MEDFFRKIPKNDGRNRAKVLQMGTSKAIEQSYLISEMNWLRNQSMGRIGRLGRVTF